MALKMPNNPDGSGANKDEPKDPDKDRADRNAPVPPAEGQAKPFGVPWTVEAIEGGPMALERRLNQLAKAGYMILAGCGIQQVPLSDGTIGIMVIGAKMPQMPKIARPGGGPPQIMN